MSRVDLIKNVNDKSQPRQKVKHARYGEGEIISIKGDVVKVVFGGMHIKSFSYPISINNGTLTLLSLPTFVANEKAEEMLKDHRATIGKSTAIVLCQTNGLKMGWKNCTFASKNKGAYTYWANPRVELLEQEWWLMLNDYRNRKLYVFEIPAGTLSLKDIKVRADDKELADIQIQYDDMQFTDIRSKISFRRWLVRTFDY